jgi:hypothetical protein
MQPWQHGFELSDLKQLESFYAPHNQYALSVFGKFKKNDIAAHLHEQTLKLFNETGSGPAAAMVVEQSKVPSKITMFGKTVIGHKMKGDITVSRLVGDPGILKDSLHTLTEDCWLITYAGNSPIRQLAVQSGFDYVGHKITSFSEIYAVYFRNGYSSTKPREHPTVNPAELVSMAKICDVDTEVIEAILNKLQLLAPTFTNHYSNYNTMNAWSAIALRGYLPDPGFITKPQEMSDKWMREQKEQDFFMQDTNLYAQFPEVRELLSFLDGDIHRVRFMRLAPGGGELQRHTDQVDRDAGNSLGQLARLHFPLKTNSKVLFSTWNAQDEKEDYHYGFGECWVIDTRKPHMAVNGGTEERIHLVVDTIVTPKLERMICDSMPLRIGDLHGSNI